MTAGAFSPFLSTAYKYAEKGWPVFPCKKRDKKPYTEHGFKDATTDPEQIRAWWSRWPDALIGVPTGDLIGVFVLDVDPRHEGDKTLAGLVMEHGALGETLRARTQGGGEHYYFKMPQGVDVRSSNGKVGGGLDIRGNGGYVIVPPSVGIDGAYEWISKSPAADAPSWLLEAAVKTTTTGNAGCDDDCAEVQLAFDREGSNPYAQKALENEVGEVRRAAAGTRNDRLNKAAFSLGQLIGGGSLDRAVVEGELLAAARDIELEEREAVKTIRSGIDAGAKQPREMPESCSRAGRTERTTAARKLEKKRRARVKDDRVEIVLGDDEDRVNLEAIKALSKAKNLYQRGASLVMVSREAMPGRVIRPNGASHIALIAPALLRERASSVCKFLLPSGSGKKAGYSIVHPPQYAINAIHARRGWPHIPPLKALVEYPVLLPDGTLLSEPGYDQDSGLLLIDGFECAPVPHNPTRDAVAAAVALLSEAVADFPFAGDANRSAWLAGLLTLLGRHAFDGCAPLTLIDANTRGSGKGLLVDALSLIATGREMPRTPAPQDDEEFRKSITAIAIAGDPVVLIDNVVGALGCPALDAALTAPVWKERILGRSENTGSLPLLAVWFATGNNVVLKGDTARRVVHVRLHTRDERPEERQGFIHSDLRAWIKAERPKLLAAALTILRGFCAAGRPDQRLAPWGSFEGWSNLVRQSIVWAGLADPAATREALMETADRETAILRQLLHGLLSIGCVGAGSALTAKRILEIAESQDADGGLSEAVAELATGPGGKPTPRSLGMRLEGLKDRVCDGMALERLAKTNQGVRWRVAACNRASDSSDRSDTSGHSLNARENNQKEYRGVEGVTSVTSVTDRDGDSSMAKSAENDADDDDPIAAESI